MGKSVQKLMIFKINQIEFRIKCIFWLHLTSAFQKSKEKGVTGLNVAQIDFKASFRMPKF